MRRLLGLLIAVVGCDCGERTGGEPIARCADRNGDVRSHPAESTTWDPLSVGALLEAGAWIQTAEASTARIQFLTGSELRIDPSSVVVLDAPDDEVEGGMVSLKSGTVRGAIAKAAPGRQLVVRTASGKKMRIDADAGDVSYRVRVAEEGDVELAVTSGRAKVVSEDGTEVSLGRGQVQSVSNGKLVGRVEELPEVPQPESAVQEDERVRLSWAPSKRATKYRVRVQRNGTLVIDEVVTAPELIVEQPPGVIEWNVTAIDEAGRESEPSPPKRTEIDKVVPDLLLAPAKGTVIRFSGGRPSVTFRWKSGSAMLIVARDEALTDIAFSGEGEGALRTRALDAGVYWWTAKDATDRRLSPRPRKLTLQKSRRGIRLPQKLEWK